MIATARQGEFRRALATNTTPTRKNVEEEFINKARKRCFSSESSHGEVLKLGRKDDGTSYSSSSADGEIYQSEREKMVQRYKGVETASKMQLNKLARVRVRREFAKWSADTGSSGVQIAILTARIAYLTEHLKAHKKDLHSKRGLTLMLEKRKKLLKYLRRTDAASYADVIVRLGLKDRSFSEEPLGARWPMRRKRS